MGREHTGVIYIKEDSLAPGEKIHPPKDISPSRVLLKSSSGRRECSFQSVTRDKLCYWLERKARSKLNTDHGRISNTGKSDSLLHMEERGKM